MFSGKSSPSKLTKSDSSSEKGQQQEPSKQQSLEYLLDHYCLKDIVEIVDITLDKELSRQFRQKHPEFREEQQQEELISKKLQKLAMEHSYNEMYIYYQQFPMHLEECKRVLRHKYKTDDILRTHLNRKSIWMLCSGALFKIRQNPGYYDKLNLHQSSNPEFFKHTIEKDVVRTIQEKNDFQSEQILSTILRKLAIKNPYIGYCQGMNFIVNFLILMQFSQEEIFWMMSQILEEFLPKTYYTNMMGVAVDIYIIEEYVKHHHPQLYERLNEMGLSLSLFTLEWLVCLFTTTLPFYVTNMLVIIWDLVFLYGSSILLKVCIVILEELQATILETEDISQLLGVIESKKKGIFIQEDEFIARISNIYIDTTLLNLSREIIELKLLKEKVEVNSTIMRNKKQQEIQCCIDWPVCFKALKSHKSDMGEIETWTFKEEGPPKIINDYLILKKKSSFKPLEDSRSEERRMIIGRIPHICDVKGYDKKQKIEKESIQLDQYDLLNRRALVNNLKAWTNKIEEIQGDNKHVSFYKRATSSNLAFLNFNNPAEKKGIRNSKEGLRQSSKHPTNLSKLNSISVIVEQDQITDQYPAKTIPVNKKNKQESITSSHGYTKSAIIQAPIIQEEQIKTRNPFKRIKKRISQKSK